MGRDTCWSPGVITPPHIRKGSKLREVFELRSSTLLEVLFFKNSTLLLPEKQQAYACNQLQPQGCGSTASPPPVVSPIGSNCLMKPKDDWSLKALKVQGRERSNRPLLRNSYSYLSWEGSFVFLISPQSLHKKLRCLIQGGNLAESLLRLRCWEAALLAFLWKSLTASPYFRVTATDDLWLSMSATPPEIKYSHFTDKELTTRASKEWGA